MEDAKKVVTNTAATATTASSASTPPTTSSSSSSIAASSSNEDDSLRSSSTFNTWTILPPERVEEEEGSETKKKTNEADEGGHQKRNQKNSEAEELTNDKCSGSSNRALEDSQIDDISDGISIISDCESTDRISPHPFLREHLNDMTYTFEAGEELPIPSLARPIPLAMPLADQVDHLRQRRQERPAAPAETTTAKNTQLEKSSGWQGAMNRQFLPPVVQTGLTGLFYVGATLAILAFLGKLRYPEWPALGGEGSKPLADLEQKLNDLEMQNNLMRAEIDIIAKQVNFLSSQGQQQGQQPNRQKAGKTFKAWSGNGNSMEPVEITKADLKRPYECPDGKFVEIAAMCVENQPHAESLADEIGNVVNDVLQHSQTFQNFEKITEQLGTLGGEATQAEGKTNGNQQPGRDYKWKQQQQQHQQHQQATGDQHWRHQHKHKDHSKEQQHQQRFKEQQRYNSKENDSKEHYQNKRYKENSSKERDRDRYNKYDKSENSHERHSHKRRHNGHDGDDDDDQSGSGEWHEKMMQQREKARARQEQKNNKNWYIKRGDSREQKRSGESVEH